MSASTVSAHERVPSTRVTTAKCATGEAWACRSGEFLRIGGEGLGEVTAVRFAGSRRARPRAASEHRVLVAVPHGASSGPVRVVTDVGGAAASPQPVEIIDPAVGDPAPAGDDAVGDEGVFPIRGSYEFGRTDANRFGGGRGHQGQDVFAKCGTPLVAAVAGTVQRAKYESAAGNHVVLEDDEGQSYVYMHMRDRASVSTGDAVSAGDVVGYVGETGRATGCHLHFELWTAPGWYRGGEPVDPMQQLRSWGGTS